YASGRMVWAGAGTPRARAIVNEASSEADRIWFMDGQLWDSVRDHDFEVLGGPLATLFPEVVHVGREERSQDAVRGDLERRQLLRGGVIGREGAHRTLVEPVDGVGG